MVNITGIDKFIKVNFTNNTLQCKFYNMKKPAKGIDQVITCENLDETLNHYMETLGYKLECIFPADRPKTAIVFKNSSRIQLGANDILEFKVSSVQQSFVINKIDDGVWGIGRAGMQYRDLIPDRQGGRFIASHIRILEGGPVPDYVHYHKIRFQMIYVYKGWVKLVYEDQGPPFIMNAGDCVLQPPEIRHRVLECSQGFEVIEISCPAEHMTYAEHDIALPTSLLQPDRDFNGQRYVFHKAENASWQTGYISGFEYNDIGIAAATDGLASAQVSRIKGAVTEDVSYHNGEFLFMFILSGKCILNCSGEQKMTGGDVVVIPAQMHYSFNRCSDDLEILEVVLPARV